MAQKRKTVTVEDHSDSDFHTPHPSSADLKALHPSDSKDEYITVPAITVPSVQSAHSFHSIASLDKHKKDDGLSFSASKQFSGTDLPELERKLKEEEKKQASDGTTNALKTPTESSDDPALQRRPSRIKVRTLKYNLCSHQHQGKLL